MVAELADNRNPPWTFYDRFREMLPSGGVRRLSTTDTVEELSMPQTLV
jgi:hypothetical protein